MKRTNADGFAPGNLYTEGNPGLGVPATVVGAEEMNNIQEEIALVVEAAGIALDAGTLNQMLSAIDILIGAGGSAQIKQDIDNNAGPTDIPGLIFDKTKTKAARCQVDLFRRTDTVLEQRNETGELFFSFDTELGVWEKPVFISHQPTSEDKNEAGVTFTIDAATGQAKYSSTDLAGLAYSATYRIWDIKKAAL